MMQHIRAAARTESLLPSELGGFYGENGIGTLYSFEQFDPKLDFWQLKYQILSEEPSGEDIRSAQEAEVDFSGLSVKLGLIIKF